MVLREVHGSWELNYGTGVDLLYNVAESSNYFSLVNEQDGVTAESLYEGSYNLVGCYFVLESGTCISGGVTGYFKNSR